MQLSRLIERWGAPLAGPLLDPHQELGPVCTDSRQLRPGSLFVPLVGERFDGHRFLAEAARLGAQAALVQRDRAGLVPEGLACWLVDDTLAAYQELGLLWRRQLAAPVLAVTGSVGKTTTRELLRSVLATTGPVWASQGNENNDIGVPLTLLQATAEHRAVVVEMGHSMGGGLSEPATGRAAHRLRWLPGQGPHGGWCGARMRHALWCSPVMAGGEREQRARARLAAHGRSPAPLDWGIMECAATREGEAEREVLSSPGDGGGGGTQSKGRRRWARLLQPPTRQHLHQQYEQSSGFSVRRDA